MYNLLFSQSSGSRFSKYLFKHKTGFLQGLALVRYSRTIIWLVSSCSVKRALSGMWCYWERKKEWFQRPVTGFRECLATVVFPAARTNDSHRRVHHSYLDSKCFKTELRAWLLSLNDTRFRQMPVLCLLMSLQWKNTEHSRHVLKALFWQFYALRAACLNLEGCFTALKIYTFLFHWIMSRLLKPSPLGKQTAQTEI